MTSVAENIISIKNSIPDYVTLVAVSKTKPNSDLLAAYNTGQRVYGENKVQELARKYEELPKDIKWHMIGHLQTNKVKYIAPFISLIHSVDSQKLLATINKEAVKNNRIIDCLIQCKIAEEETKFGMSESDIAAMLTTGSFAELKNIRIAGIMGMASYTDDEDQVRQEFKALKTIFNNLKADFFLETPGFSVISMGMSHDYQIAISEGATMIRVGSSIFGERNYSKTK